MTPPRVPRVDATTRTLAMIVPVLFSVVDRDAFTIGIDEACNRRAGPDVAGAPRIGGMMRHAIWTGTCAAIVSVATAGILAQTTAQTPTPQQSTPSSSDNNKITVTGCLKAAPSATGDAAGASTTAGTSGTTAAGTAGTTGTTAAGTTAGTTGTTSGATSGQATGTAGAATDAKFVLTSATA